MAPVMNEWVLAGVSTDSSSSISLSLLVIKVAGGGVGKAGCLAHSREESCGRRRLTVSGVSDNRRKGGAGKLRGNASASCSCCCLSVVEREFGGRRKGIDASGGPPRSCCGCSRCWNSSDRFDKATPAFFISQSFFFSFSFSPAPVGPLESNATRASTVSLSSVPPPSPSHIFRRVDHIFPILQLLSSVR